MKNILTTLLVGCAMAFATQLSAQVDLKYMAGAGLALGTYEGASFGIQIRGDIDITDKWGGSLNFIPYFKSDYKLWEINFDGHYMIYETDPWSFYALAGLNLTTFGFKGVGNVFGIDTGITATKIGLNLGGGARYAIAENILLYGELKFVASGYAQLVVTAGGLYRF